MGPGFLACFGICFSVDQPINKVQCGNDSAVAWKLLVPGLLGH